MRNISTRMNLYSVYTRFQKYFGMVSRILNRTAGPLVKTKDLKTLDNSKPRNILVTPPRALGDSVMFMPTLNHLKRSFPQAEITLLRPYSFAEIYEGANLCDKIIFLDFDQGLNPFYLLRILKSLYSNKFDLAINSSAFGNVFSFMARISRRIGFYSDRDKYFFFLNNVRVKSSEEIHSVYRGLDLLAPLGLSYPLEIELLLPVSQKNSEFACEFLRQKGIGEKDLIIGIHPGSGNNKKRWGIGNYAKLIQEIRIKYPQAKILIFEGPDEIGIAKEIENDQSVIVANSLNLHKISAIMERCSLFLSNDSGLMHLATALNVPVIAIFGPSDPRLYGPFGKIHEIISRDDIECRPCGLEAHTYSCKTKDLKCLDIRPEVVFQVVEKKIEDVLN